MPPIESLALAVYSGVRSSAAAAPAPTQRITASRTSHQFQSIARVRPIAGGGLATVLWSLTSAVIGAGNFRPDGLRG